jgi:hypothetical protein
MKKQLFQTALLGALALLFSFAAFAVEVPNLLNAVSAASGNTGVKGAFSCSGEQTIKAWGSGTFAGTFTITGYSTNPTDTAETATILKGPISSPLDGSEFYVVPKSIRYLKVAYTRSAGTFSAHLGCSR